MEDKRIQIKKKDGSCFGKWGKEAMKKGFGKEERKVFGVLIVFH